MLRIALIVITIIFATRSEAQDIRALVSTDAAEAGVPDAIAHAVIRKESGYRAGASSSGNIGLGQIRCQTAKGIGFAGACRELYDPGVNLKWSMRYLGMALRRGGGGCAGVSLYQRGIGGRPVCTAYGRAILGHGAAFREGKGDARGKPGHRRRFKR